MRNVTLKQLRSVAAIIRTGRIVTAAKELHLTTPAITSQIKLLERELGLPLFERTQSGMRPTAAGSEVFRTASRIADLLRECEERISDLKGLRGGIVSVGVVSTGKYYAPRLIAAFMRANPHIEISLAVGNRNNIVEALQDYQIDLAIMGQPPRDFEVEATPFGDHPLILVASPDHPLAGRRGLTKRDLTGERFLIREEGSGTRAAFEAFMADIPRRETRIGMEIGSNETIKQGVMAGLGIALISGHAVARELADGHLVSLDVEPLPVMRQWFTVRRSDRTMSTAAEAFLDFLSRLGADFLPPAALFQRGGGRADPEARAPAAGRESPLLPSPADAE